MKWSGYEDDQQSCSRARSFGTKVLQDDAILRIAFHIRPPPSFMVLNLESCSGL